MKISTVLLDAGGVILDESEHEAVRAEIAVQVLGRVVAGYSFKAYYADIAGAVAAFAPNVYHHVLSRHANSDSQSNSLLGRYDEIWRKKAPPLKLQDGIEPELRELSRHYGLAIAGQYGSGILDLLRRHSLLECFAHKFTQDDFTITKPDPRYCQQMAAAAGVSPEECVMVGDRIDKDVIPAKNIGMRTIRIRVGLHRDQRPRRPSEAPDAELNSVVGLAAAVRALAA